MPIGTSDLKNRPPCTLSDDKLSYPSTADVAVSLAVESSKQMPLSRGSMKFVGHVARQLVTAVRTTRHLVEESRTGKAAFILTRRLGNGAGV